MSTPVDREDLIARLEAGETFAFLPFWGHTPKKDGTNREACFSQWYAAPFDVDGVTYPTCEHYMMAGKARLFGDESSLRRILGTEDPGRAKAVGRRVANFDDAVWRQNSRGIVEAGNEAKFRQHPAIGSFLCSTAPKVLVEASPRDCIWGIGLGRDNPKVRVPSEWRGRNLLGFALMTVRDRLLESSIES